MLAFDTDTANMEDATVNITRYPEEFGCYRYKLRIEGIDLSGKDDRGEVAFIMFNTATTNEERDLETGSQTRNRCIKVASDEGYGTLTEVNLFAYRAPDRDALYKAVVEEGIDAVGPENDRVLRDAVTNADLLVVAWGNTNGNRRFDERAKKVAELLRSLNKQIYCLGKNSDGSSKHPARGPNRLQSWS